MNRSLGQNSGQTNKNNYVARQFKNTPANERKTNGRSSIDQSMEVDTVRSRLTLNKGAVNNSETIQEEKEKQFIYFWQALPSPEGS